MSKSKGFTIIELLVVVAIIAVLSAIVLGNATQFINKSKDAAIKVNMTTILTSGAVHYDKYTTYANFNTSTGYTVAATAIASANLAPTYVGTTDQYCVKAILKDATTYCVDSTGYKGELVPGKCVGGDMSIYTCQ